MHDPQIGHRPGLRSPADAAGSGPGSESRGPDDGTDPHPANVPEPHAESTQNAGPETGPALLAQLQAKIDSLATQSAPVIREVGAKAAELAAAAAERAGPAAQRAANATLDVGGRLASRSRDLAADLRRPQPGADAGEAPDAGQPSSGDGATSDGPSDAGGTPKASSD